MAEKKEIEGLPGFFWEYEPGHGYLGRHAYNPLTGEAYALRQVYNLRAGKATLPEIREKTYGVIATREETTKYGYEYNITGFARLDAAIDWAGRLENPSYILALGRPRTKYKTDKLLNKQGQLYSKHDGEPAPELAWRALTGMQEPTEYNNPSKYREGLNREDIFAGVFEHFDPKYQQFVRYYVYEQLPRT